MVEVLDLNRPLGYEMARREKPSKEVDFTRPRCSFSIEVYRLLAVNYHQ
jgi:hypothetical protein